MAYKILLWFAIITTALTFFTGFYYVLFVLYNGNYDIRCWSREARCLMCLSIFITVVFFSAVVINEQKNE